MSVLNFDVFWRDHGAEKGLEGLGKSSEDAGSKFGKMGKAIAGGATAAGVTAGGLLAKGFSDNLDLEAGRAKMSAQLGLSSDESARIGKAAGQLYANNYGDSMDDVNEALGSVIQNIDGMRDASNDSLNDITKKVLNLQTSTGETSDAISRAISQMLRTGLAKNADEALDIVTKGFQSGANKSEDFLDTLNEYGTQFRKLGIDGTQATGLISQGLKAGARDGDLVADSLKEFSLRAIGGGDAVNKAFKGIGLNGKQMSKDIAAGGPVANKALDETLDHLRAIKDPAERSRIAVQLFGTQAEDLGDALYALDPSSAVKAMGDVSGAADSMDKTLSDTGKGSIETMKRGFEQWTQRMAGADGPLGNITAGVISFGGPALAMGGQIASIISGFALLNPATALASAKTAALAVKDGIVATATGAWTAAQWLLNAALNANPISLIIIGVAALGVGLVVLWKKSQTAREVMSSAFAGIATAVLSMAKILLSAWREIVTGVLGAAAKILDALGKIPGNGWAKRAAADVRGYKQNAEDSFNAAIRKTDEWKSAVNKLPKKIKLEGNISDLNQKINAAKAKLREKGLTDPQKTKIRADISQLIAQRNKAQSALNNLHGKTVTVTTFFKTVGAQPGTFGNGLGVNKRAKGGPVTAGQPYLVGERGPELIIPGQTGTVLTAAETKSVAQAGNLAPSNSYANMMSVAASTPAGGNSSTGTPIDYGRLAKELARAVDGMVVMMDGKALGRVMGKNASILGRAG